MFYYSWHQGKRVSSEDASTSIIISFIVMMYDDALLKSLYIETCL